jgi:hypothetical protein
MTRKPTPKIILGSTFVMMILMVVILLSQTPASASSGSRDSQTSMLLRTPLTPSTESQPPADSASNPVAVSQDQNQPEGNPRPTLPPTLSPFGDSQSSPAQSAPTPVPQAQAAISVQAAPYNSVPVIAQSQPQDSSGVPVIHPTFLPPVKPPYFNNILQFANAVANGQADDVRGVFVKDLITMPVVSQPQDDNNWVSSNDNEITLFRAAIEHGTIGLLAHNTRGGRDFNELKSGATITLVMGDKTTKKYRITKEESFQALAPLDPAGDFIDLSNGAQVTAGDVFTRLYAGGYPVVLQTCIEKGGNSEWGRLFLIAEPA